MFGDYIYANPNVRYLLLLLIPLIAWYIYKQRNLNPCLTMSSVAPIEKMPQTALPYLRHLLFVLRVITISALIIALARPQTLSTWENVKTEGIDIVLAMDVSGSMLAKDFEPNRLEASKDVATNFVSGRKYDRIGLVVFSGESFTQCPITTDHAVVINMLRQVKTGMMEDGTAMGLGLANAVNRLKNSDAVSKVVILLTDGVNNKGNIPPLTAAEIAKKFNVKVYTIGVGSQGKAYSPVGIYPDGTYAFDYIKVEIDEEILKQIAEKTDGKYFRATDKNALKEVYKNIDKLEKSIIEVKEHSKKHEEFWIFVVIAGIALFLEILLRNTVLRTNP